jgi:hypothetical protein
MCPSKGIKSEADQRTWKERALAAEHKLAQTERDLESAIEALQRIDAATAALVEREE